MACGIKNEVEFPRKVDQEKIMVLLFQLGIEPGGSECVENLKESLPQIFT